MKLKKSRNDIKMTLDYLQDKLDRYEKQLVKGEYLHIESVQTDIIWTSKNIGRWELELSKLDEKIEKAEERKRKKDQTA